MLSLQIYILAFVLYYINTKTNERYEGEFQNGYINGKGILIQKDGDEFVGEWQNNKIHGKGKLTCINGDSYDGEWVDDQRSAEGQ